MLTSAIRNNLARVYIPLVTQNGVHCLSNHLNYTRNQPRVEKCYITRRLLSTGALGKKNYSRTLVTTTTKRDEIQKTADVADGPLLDNASYERVCAETLDALCDYFEELIEQANHLPGSDVSYGDGVLTIKLGSESGTYVINRQTPNKQIWLSSPYSGPKRYDFVGPNTAEHGKWIYKHTNQSLHELLQTELPSILKQKVNFLELPYGS